jgi:hypothetical protein
MMLTLPEKSRLVDPIHFLGDIDIDININHLRYMIFAQKY